MHVLKLGCEFGMSSSWFFTWTIVFHFSCSLWHGNFFVCFFVFPSTLHIPLYTQPYTPTPQSYFSATFSPGLTKEAAFSSYSVSCCSEIGMCVYKTRKINVLVDEFHYLPNGPWKLMTNLQAGSFSLNVKSSIEFLYLFKNKFDFMTRILFSSLN